MSTQNNADNFSDVQIPTEPEKKEVRPERYAPKDIKPDRLNYEPVDKADEELARYYFGKDSNAAAANNLSFQRPEEYKRLKAVAIKLGLVWG